MIQNHAHRKLLVWEKIEKMEKDQENDTKFYMYQTRGTEVPYQNVMILQLPCKAEGIMM